MDIVSIRNHLKKDFIGQSKQQTINKKSSTQRSSRIRSETASYKLKCVKALKTQLKSNGKSSKTNRKLSDQRPRKLSRQIYPTPTNSKEKTFSNIQKMNMSTYSKTVKEQVELNAKGRTIKDVRKLNTGMQTFKPIFGSNVSSSRKQASNQSKKVTVSRSKEIVALHNKENIILQTQMAKEKCVKKKNERNDIGCQDNQFLRYLPLQVDEKKHSITNFVVLQTVNEQSYFTDYLAIHNQTCGLFSIRALNKAQVLEEEREEQLAEAIKIHIFLSNFHFPHIQTLYTIIEDPLCIYLMMEPLLPSKMDQLSLFNEAVLQSGINETLFAVYAKQLLQTLEQLHRSSIILRTINLDFFKVHLGILKIELIDTTASLTKRKRRDSFLGNIQVIPQQLALGQSYSFGYDMWSVGIILYVLATGVHPFAGMQSLGRVKCLQYNFPMNISKQLGDLIYLLLTEQSTRLSATEALQHPFLKQVGRECTSIPKDMWNYWQR